MRHSLRIASRVWVFLVVGAFAATRAWAQSIADFSIPTAGSNPYTITTGPDGAMWFTEAQGNKIGRITTAGAITEYPIPSTDAQPLAITQGPDGAMWFTAYNANGIGRISTGGVVTGAQLSTPNNTPWGIAAGPDGALWFTESAGNKIGRITTATVITNEFTIPTSASHPHAIVAGPDGALWFTESTGAKIGRITTAGAITEFPLPDAHNQPQFITVGPDGALWFTELGGQNGQPPAGKIGRITTSGVLTEFPTPFKGPYGIVAGPDGALWFTAFGGTGNPDQLGRITTAGVITNQQDYPTSGGGGLFGMAAGPDGAIWFAENGAGKIGHLVAGGCPFNATTFCGNNFRFKVSVAFTTPSERYETERASAAGAGQAVPLTSDTGYFWFFSSNNVELVVKVVDGRAVNNHFWVFAGGLTNVNVVITVTDTQTAAVKTYTNPQGTAFQPIQDTSAFVSTPEGSFRTTAGDAAAQAAAGDISSDLSRLLQAEQPRQPAGMEAAHTSQAACAPNATTMCLNGGRFQVRVTWKTSDNQTGSGQSVPLTADTGYFWFFSSNNVEMVIKAVDGRALNNHFWVFAGGLTNVNVVIEVVDTQTGTVKTYTNAQGAAFQPIQDTSAFPG